MSVPSATSTVNGPAGLTSWAPLAGWERSLAAGAGAELDGGPDEVWPAGRDWVCPAGDCAPGVT
ncbi:MAG TPA: hypothetical protein VE287_06865 [Actinopolymorphaceae bacterium]|nr:hypothetical protein [Actinopolymorphaceae bacterium]